MVSKEEWRAYSPDPLAGDELSTYRVGVKSLDEMSHVLGRKDGRERVDRRCVGRRGRGMFEGKVPAEDGSESANLCVFSTASV